MSPEQRLEAEIKAIRRELAEIKALIQRGGASNGGAARGGGAVADDRELDSDYGNFTIKRDPPRWEGQSYVGYKLSETEPAYLDVLASFKDWQADKDEQQDKRDAKGRPTAPMNRKDAARARGWAARLRNGWAPGGGGHVNGRGAPAGGGYEQHASGFSGDDADGDIPFASSCPSHDLRRWGL